MTLQEWMQNEGMSDAQFARRLARSTAAVNKWRNGLRTPRADALRQIVEATDGQVTANDFFAPEAQA